MEGFEVLGRLPLFAGLEPADLQSLGALVRKRSFPKGSTVFSEGEPVAGLYFLMLGRLKIIRRSVDGQESIIHVLRTGEIFGGAAFFDRGPLPATAETLADSVVGVLERRDLEELLRQRPQVAMKMLEAMGERLRETQRRLAGLSRQDVSSRLAEVLLILGRKFGTAAGAELRLGAPLTHQELADLIGSSRETVSRILGDFRRRGLVEITREAWVLKRVAELEELAQ